MLHSFDEAVADYDIIDAAVFIIGVPKEKFQTHCIPPNTNSPFFQTWPLFYDIS